MRNRFLHRRFSLLLSLSIPAIGACLHLLSAHILGNASRSDALRPVQAVSLSDGQASSSVSLSGIPALSPAHKAQEEVSQEPLYKWNGSIRDEAFYAQGKRVMFAWGDDPLGRPHVELFEAATGKHLASLVGLDVQAEREFNLNHAAIAPDGSRVFLCGSNTDGFYALDIPHRQVAWNSGFSENEDVPEYIAVSADSKYLLLDLSFTAELRSMKTGEIIKTLLSFSAGENPQHAEYVGALAFSSDGKHAATSVVTVEKDNTIILWTIPAGKRLQKFHCPDVRQVLFSPDGHYLLTLSTDPKNAEADKNEANSVRLWDWRTGKLVRQFSLPIEHMPCQVAFTPDGKQLIANGKQMSIWDVQTGQEVRCFSKNGARSGFFDFSLSPDGRYILSRGQLWQFATGKLLRTFYDP